MAAWANSLDTNDVFFSLPLDLDLTIQKTFPEAYKATIAAGGGPKMAVDKAAEAVLGTAGPGLTLYVGAFKNYSDLLPAYRCHFLTRSKSATHLAALTHIRTKVLRDSLRSCAKSCHTLPPTFVEIRLGSAAATRPSGSMDADRR